MAMIPEQKALDAPHKITLDARSRLSITGVLEIESFDEGMIALATTRGPLVIHGQGLHLQELTAGGGEVRRRCFAKRRARVRRVQYHSGNT